MSSKPRDEYSGGANLADPDGLVQDINGLGSGVDSAQASADTAQVTADTALVFAADNADWTSATISGFPSGSDVVLTALGSNSTDGAVRATAHFFTAPAPTS